MNKKAKSLLASAAALAEILTIGCVAADAGERRVRRKRYSQATALSAAGR